MQMRSQHLVLFLSSLLMTVTVMHGQNQGIGKPMFTVSPLSDARMADAITASSVTTIPYWRSTFTASSKSWPYSMVGASPFANPNAATTVETELQPITFKFPNGTVISGTAAAVSIANSPIFVSTKFPTGTGQYGDVFQRANFAKPIGTHAYHVKLGLPSIRSAIVVDVPKGSGSTGKTTSGVVYGLVNLSFLTKTISSLVGSGKYNASSLPIFVAGNIFEYQQITALCCVLGYHGAQSSSAGQLNTFIYTSYPSAGLFNGGFADVAVLSHEVAEWMDDPFGTNIVAPWAQPQHPSTCFSNLLEVGDAIEAFPNANFTVTLNGKTYHVQDEAFFSWFARQNPSIGLGGRYSYLSPAKLTKPAPVCS